MESIESEDGAKVLKAMSSRLSWDSWSSLFLHQLTRYVTANTSFITIFHGKCTEGGPHEATYWRVKPKVR